LLRKLWLRWKALAQKIGNFQARVILSLFYFTFVAPFGLALRVFSDPLRTKPKGLPSYWLPRESASDFESATRQF